MLSELDRRVRRLPRWARRIVGVGLRLSAMWMEFRYSRRFV
jgi:hypothetical protein